MRYLIIFSKDAKQVIGLKKTYFFLGLLFELEALVETVDADAGVGDNFGCMDVFGALGSSVNEFSCFKVMIFLECRGKGNKL